jgi:hypothetical protein
MRQSRALSPSLKLLTLLVLAFLWVPTLAAQSSDADQLTALARAAVEAHNDVLVSGNVDEALRKRAEGERFRRALEANGPMISNRRNAMAKDKMRYTSHRTTLKIENTDVNGNSATQRATEHVVLALEIPGAGPQETEYEQAHVLEYAKEGDSWSLVSDKIVTPPPLPEEIPAPADTAPMREAPPGYRPDPSKRRPPQTGQPSVASMTHRGVVRVALSRPPLDIRLAATAYYNATAAVNYALTYVFNYNSSYRVYSSNDCTNFTSQAMQAGGWPFDETGGRTEPTTWYYGSFDFTTSYSWAAAHNFYLFFNQSGRGFMASYFSDLIKGDMVQADWGPTPDGNISHSMIVDDVINGVAFVTYHSTNTKHRSLNDIAAQYPGTNWYGLLMYSSFTY